MVIPKKIHIFHFFLLFSFFKRRYNENITFFSSLYSNKSIYIYDKASLTLENSVEWFFYFSCLVSFIQPSRLNSCKSQLLRDFIGFSRLASLVHVSSLLVKSLITLMWPPPSYVKGLCFFLFWNSCSFVSCFSASCPFLFRY